MTPGSRFSLFSGFGFFCLGGKDRGPDISPYHYGTNILSSSTLGGEASHLPGGWLLLLDLLLLLKSL